MVDLGNNSDFNPISSIGDFKMTPDFIDILNHVHGFISLAEVELLYALASQVPNGGNIVEIGAAQGRSTVSLALGAKEAGAMVWSIDPHNTYEVDGVTFSMEDNQAYYENIARYQVGSVVKTINLSSELAEHGWKNPIDLLFIDGKHEYEDVSYDYYMWARHTKTILFHDTAGFHPGVDKLVNEILAAGQWTRVNQVDAISVFERVK